MGGVSSWMARVARVHVCMGGMSQILVWVTWVVWVHKFLAWVTWVVWFEILAWVSWVHKILAWVAWVKTLG